MRTLVLFTRSPEAEARAKGLPRKAGARLFRELLGSWCRAARRADVRLLMMAPPTSVPALERLYASDRVTIEAQCGPAFGDRVEHALARAFASGATPVLLVAGDSPAPSAEALQRAFAGLEGGRQVVLGPAPDGGVNIIGLARPEPRLLDGVPWTSPDVDRTLRERAAQLQLGVDALPPVLDIDRLADVHRALALCHADASWRQLHRALAALSGETPAPPAPPPALCIALLAADLAARGPPAVYLPR